MTTPHRPRFVVTLLLVIIAGSVGYYAGRRTAGWHKADVATCVQDGTVKTATVLNTQTGLPQAEDWRALVARPATVKRNDTMAAWLERLAATAPEQAVRYAQAEVNSRLREQLLAAALRGWARVSPEAAANWALERDEPNAKASAVRAVFAGAAERPGEAVRLAKTIFERDPAGAMDHGMALIDGLVEAGHGEVASRVAIESQPAQQVWVIEAFSKWAVLQPAEAARAAALLPEGESRVDALRGVANGWGEVDPGGLSQFLAVLPASGTRRELLGHSLRQWVSIEPGAASKWINGVELGPDMDEGVSAVATMASLKPEVATSWAESIESPQLRSETLAAVLREWGAKDANAAAQYLAKTQDLHPDERRMLTDFFSNNLGVASP